MTLATLIKKNGLRELATATHATHDGKNGPTVATVAVADPQKLAMDSSLSATDELKICKWFTHINETDQDIINELLDNCRTNPKCREYFLQRAEEIPPIVVHS